MSDNDNKDEDYDPYSDPDSGLYDPYLDPDSPENQAWDDYLGEGEGEGESEGEGEGGGGEPCQEIPGDADCIIERMDEENCVRICSWFDEEHGTGCGNIDDVDCPGSYI